MNYTKTCQGFEFDKLLLNKKRIPYFQAPEFFSKFRKFENFKSKLLKMIKIFLKNKTKALFLSIRKNCNIS